MEKDFFKNKEEIEGWLNKYYIKNYTLIPNEKYGYVVDVQKSVDLSSVNLDWIPIKFNKIKGNLNCCDNRLTSLEFCPEKVGRSFWCDKNQLVSLEGCPQEICGNFACSKNQLENLLYFPQNIKGSCYINQNKKLDNLQDETDFKVLYQVHLGFKRKKELYENLNNSIDEDSKQIRKNKI